MPMTILILGAHEDSRAMWTAVVRELTPGSVVFSTGSLVEAQRWSGEHQPAVLIVDMGIPGTMDLLADAHIVRTDHHVLILVPPGFDPGKAYPGSVRRLLLPVSLSTLREAIQQVLDLAAAIASPRVDAHPEDRIVHHGEVEEHHLDHLQTVPRILVVDDNAMVLRFVETALGREFPDHAIITVETGLEGMDCARHLHPRLVLLDYALPDFNGDAFAQHMRADPELATTPIVLMSGYAEELRDVAVSHPNVVGTLTKPFKTEALFQVLRRAMAFKPPAPSERRQFSEMTTRIIRGPTS
jgi:CheY-like chemotaxis protein